MKSRKSLLFPSLILWVTLALYGVAAVLVSVTRFWQYEAFYDSFGLFDSVIWQVSRFTIPIIDHVALGRMPVFADHLYPTILLLAPVYWLTSRSEVLLVIQALAVTLSGLVLFRIGKKMIGNDWVAYGIMTAYLLFVGLQNAIIADFHEVTIATLPLMLTFWAIANNRKKLFYLFLLLTLGCKESMMFTGFGIGIFLFFIPQWRRQAWFTLALSALWGYIAIRLIIPYFSHGIFLYNPPLSHEFSSWFTRLVDVPEKRRTIWYSLQSFLFLPLFAPPLWPLILQDFVTRFVPLYTDTRWTLGLHYNALTAVYLAVAAVYGAKNILQYIQSYTPHHRVSRVILIALPTLLILNALFLHQRTLHGPLGLAYNPAFYAHTKDFKFLDDLVSRVPHTASVMTQSNLAPRFAHQLVYLLDINYDLLKPKPAYIVVDLRDGQNPNDFFGMHGKSIPQLIDKIVADPSYEEIFTNGAQHVWRLKR